MKELILGGMRSGKSSLAEQYALQSGLEVVYIATATAGDGEMEQRIAHHRSHRPAEWIVVEEPLALSRALLQHAGEQRCVLVDCLTMWLTNILAAGGSATVAAYRHEFGQLLQELPALPGRIILVSNEVGMGVVPMGELSRMFVDEAGRMHQALAAVCGRVTLCVAGLPHVVKGGSC